MRFIVFLIGFISFTQAINAQKYYTKTGVVHFEASVPSFEEVDAKNETVTAILNSENGEIAALALVKGFRFKIALMEEHFNESYAESTKYPKVTFKGKIENFSLDKLNEEDQTHSIIGSLTFHGKTQQINDEVQISLQNNEIIITTSLILKPEDFDIKLPKIIRNKVAKTVNVSINFKLSQKK